MELRLAVEADGALDREGQGHVGGEDGGKAEPGGQGRFVPDQAERLVGFGVGVVGHAAEVAVDSLLGDDARDVLDRGLVRLAVAAGRVRTVAGRQRGVRQPVQGRDLAGGVPGDSGADARRLKDCDACGLPV